MPKIHFKAFQSTSANLIDKTSDAGDTTTTHDSGMGGGFIRIQRYYRAGGRRA